MTLTTRVAISGIRLEEAFLLARRAAKIPGEWPFEDHAEHDYRTVRHVPGCDGALGAVHAGQVGEVVHIVFDTPYGFIDDDGRGCNEIHAALVDELRAALPPHCESTWENEYEGTWHDHPAGPTIHCISTH